MVATDRQAEVASVAPSSSSKKSPVSLKLPLGVRDSAQALRHPRRLLSPCRCTSRRSIAVRSLLHPTSLTCALGTWTTTALMPKEFSLFEAVLGEILLD